ncbi:MAG: hypothetical protein MZV70_67015 [Desulfobacterales bacterium]|nr:hypothetical protein [Desulfobacterales bacterium]
MKKMLPGKDGTLLPSSMVTGDYVIIVWKLANVYDKTYNWPFKDFVQNKTTREFTSR